MTRKMTIVFHDDELYEDLKITAIRLHKTASEIVAEAVQEWLDAKEDEELVPIIEAAVAEYDEKGGGRPWEEVEKELREAMDKREKPIMVADRKNVRH